jgi:hypothetical protein
MNDYDYDVPILDLKGYMGSTDYIDFLRWEDLEYPAMKGFDRFNRKFFVIKMLLTNNMNSKKRKIIQVFFKRYTTSGDTGWQGASYGYSLINTSGGMDSHQVDLIDKLMRGKLVEITEEHRSTIFSSSSEYRDFVANLDYWQIKAANIIKKNWLIAHYNPNYSLCKTRLNREYDEYLNE